MIDTSGNIASIVGLILTVWVAFSVNSLRKYYLFKGRHSNLLKDLREACRTLSLMLSGKTFEKDESEVLIRKSKSSLQAIVRLAPKEYKASSKIAIKRIDKSIRDKSLGRKEVVREIYFELISAESDLNTFKEDDLWKRSN